MNQSMGLPLMASASPSEPALSSLVVGLVAVVSGDCGSAMVLVVLVFLLAIGCLRCVAYTLRVRVRFEFRCEVSSAFYRLARRNYLNSFKTQMLLENFRSTFLRCWRIRLFSSLSVFNRSILDWWSIARLRPVAGGDGRRRERDLEGTANRRLLLTAMDCVVIA